VIGTSVSITGAREAGAKLLAGATLNGKDVSVVFSVLAGAAVEGAKDIGVLTRTKVGLLDGTVVADTLFVPAGTAVAGAKVTEEFTFSTGVRVAGGIVSDILLVAAGAIDSVGKDAGAIEAGAVEADELSCETGAILERGDGFDVPLKLPRINMGDELVVEFTWATVGKRKGEGVTEILLVAAGDAIAGAKDMEEFTRAPGAKVELELLVAFEGKEELFCVSLVIPVETTVVFASAIEKLSWTTGATVAGGCESEVSLIAEGTGVEKKEVLN
jgi:hypothetical protein